MRFFSAAAAAAALSLTVLSTLPSATLSAYCNGSPNPVHPPNMFPIATSDPVFVREVPNGKLFNAGLPGFNFSVVHLYGTPYQMGYSMGSLFNGTAASLLNNIYAYIQQQVAENFDTLPTWLADIIADAGLDIAFAVLLDMERPSIPQHFFDEIQGLSDATGVPASIITNIHLLGELTQGDCSMVGAWGQATPDGQLVAFRGLDWDTDGPFIQYPAVIVRHPSDLGHPFSSVGFVGWLGALTGMSSAGLSIHEIGVSYPDASFGNESYAGIPFVFLLRDILQFDTTYQQALQRIETANRTCDLILGVGDGPQNQFWSVQYSASVANAMTDYSMLPLNETWHPRMDASTGYGSVVYYGMDWLCPSYNSMLHSQLTSFYGNITVENVIRYIVPGVQSGDTHSAVYDLSGQQLFVSFYATNASATMNPSYPLNAYDRSYTRLNSTALYAEPAPNM